MADAPTVGIIFTEEELWVIADCVRDHGNQGKEWDKRVMRRLQEGVLDAMADAEHKAVVTFDSGDAWQVTRQINSQLRVGKEPIGRTILTKMFKALRLLDGPPDDAEMDAPGTPVPAAVGRFINHLADFDQDAGEFFDGDRGANG